MDKELKALWVDKKTHKAVRHQAIEEDKTIGDLIRDNFVKEEPVCESDCEYCGGTGEVNESTFDVDSKEWSPDSTAKCPKKTRGGS